MSLPSMSVANLAAILDQGAAIHLVDVRAAHELAQGRIAGARHLPLAELPQRLAELPADRPVVFYCHSGARSFQACRYAATQGHGELYNLDGGIVAWLRAGFELTP